MTQSYDTHFSMTVLLIQKFSQAIYTLTLEQQQITDVQRVTFQFNTKQDRLNRKSATGQIQWYSPPDTVLHLQAHLCSHSEADKYIVYSTYKPLCIID